MNGFSFRPGRALAEDDRRAELDADEQRDDPEERGPDDERRDGKEQVEQALPDARIEVHQDSSSCEAWAATTNELYRAIVTPGRTRNQSGSASRPSAQAMSAAGKFAPAMCENG